MHKRSLETELKLRWEKNAFKFSNWLNGIQFISIGLFLAEIYWFSFQICTRRARKQVWRGKEEKRVGGRHQSSQINKTNVKWSQRINNKKNASPARSTCIHSLLAYINKNIINGKVLHKNKERKDWWVH